MPKTFGRPASLRELSPELKIAPACWSRQKAYSVAKIEFPEVNDENGKPRKGGLMDPLMGSKHFAWNPLAGFTFDIGHSTKNV